MRCPGAAFCCSFEEHVLTDNWVCKSEFNCEALAQSVTATAQQGRLSRANIEWLQSHSKLALSQICQMAVNCLVIFYSQIFLTSLCNE